MVILIRWSVLSVSLSNSPETGNMSVAISIVTPLATLMSDYIIGILMC